MTIYLLVAFLLSLVCGVVFTPLILDFCKRKRLYDIPNERKVHKNATPRMGGFSFFPSMLIAFTAILMFVPITDKYNLSVNIWSAVFFIGLLVIYLTGIVDDLVGLKAPTKFIVQIATACLLPFCGLYINNLYGLFGIHEIPYYIGIPLTIFIMVLIDNAINLIDGIDGLAASISLLALTGFLVYFRHYQVFVNTYSILTAGMMGALVAFLYFNLFGKIEKNTKIFMGDSGSLSLGFTLGFLFIKCASDNTAIWQTRQEALLVPLTLLFVSMADVVRVTIYRFIHHKPLFLADKNHIHHKLMRAGLTQHQTLACILCLSVFFVILNYLLYTVLSSTWILVIDILCYNLFNTGINTQIQNHA
ncbi:glycosyltransferase family 4 protein [Prevotella sp. tf2-5]|uniref:glycosyltransferase family 4 protein n=1 Tax=Prevotella sp. tf2-5 TaxID=1761889 RepID=UPI0008E955BB|nr:MraY family glycosyltransferase [Prevotella sp. tf2-5]SFO88521.1 UDP-N-acetylmuramyl pentapeptide phosphotransferase/UDP-N-acetylglucosamine-1-phosphate transferase [Prevotella sp. tf2-5]